MHSTGTKAVKRKPVLLLYCQHSLGIGHLRRSIEIANALVRSFRVVFLNGGRFPEAIARPDGIEFIDLPPLGMGADGILVTRTKGHDLAHARITRKELILEQFRNLQPAVLLIELFPFGRKKFAFELLPLLRLAQRAQLKPLVLCSLRDILVDGRDDQQHFVNRARWLTDRYFDAVLIHTDPLFCRLEESFCPQRPLATPLFYSGFVAARESGGEPVAAAPGLVVSVGGGQVGANLLHAAVEAQPFVWNRFTLPMTVVAGPFLPEEEWRLLEKAAQGREGLTLLRSVPGLRSLLSHARASVSQCGYNTVMDLLQVRTPALLVPYSDAGENEQGKRASKLAALGLAHILPEAEVNPQNLLREIGALLQFTPTPARLDMNGTVNTHDIIVRLLEDRWTNREEGHGEVA